MSSNEWTMKAACRTADPVIFERDRNGGESQEAKKFCRRCPVQKECLLETLTLEGDGKGRSHVAGNTTPRQRNDMAKKAGGVEPLRKALRLEIAKSRKK